ncbi:putative 3-hydroxyacyl-CoA dehydrogenase [Aureobasidium pullulans]|uniref:Putative 3-hydroxyacyl-CoA dehydrogenase n=1 Tax=Aureobasidium pullulans TaxID=5580 RepID=A0A4S8Y6Y7_AURPU|nr:putative 3-hydroxyacyl-CoA dehydrogenase [Aureobasidium pullulans]
MWTPPQNYASRPVAVLGGGVLGRRIACCWASAGYNIRIRDPSEQQRNDAVEYFNANVASYAEATGKTPGKVAVFVDVESAVQDAWLVFEVVPEKLNIKIETFAELERLAPKDCILASNSSSYKSSEMIEKVNDETKCRILNTHYFMPPTIMMVELMTDGYTHPEIFPFLAERHKEAGLVPFVARKESTGFIFNRTWAAIKREFLTILAEGVSTPEELDQMWTLFWGSKQTPCRIMDQVGLDTVQFIEQHYVDERGLPKDKTVDFLEENYIKPGRLGDKCQKGGLYPPSAPDTSKIVLCELGVSKSLKGKRSTKEVLSNGRLFQVSKDGSKPSTLLEKAGLPDGIEYCKADNRLYTTDMGTFGNNDGRVFSCKLDGSDVKEIVPRGSVHTPKQTVIDEKNGKLYFCDREGLRVMCCNLDGSGLHTLVQTGDWRKPEETNDQSKWCVGITLAPNLGKLFWTQKGSPKSGKGRIFSVNIGMPAGDSATSRSDMECVLDKLPEPIDLEFDNTNNMLYWTDRGEVPYGNSLNRAQLDANGRARPMDNGLFPKHEILFNGFDETIGLRLDMSNDTIYVSDLGGTLWKLQKGVKSKVFEDKTNAFTGFVIVP